MKVKQLKKEIEQFNKINEGKHHKCIYVYWEGQTNTGISLKLHLKNARQNGGDDYRNAILDCEIEDGVKELRDGRVIPMKRFYIHQPHRDINQKWSYMIVVKDIY